MSCMLSSTVGVQTSASKYMVGNYKPGIAASHSHNFPSSQAKNIFDAHENMSANFPRVEAAAEWPWRVRGGARRGCAWE